MKKVLMLLKLQLDNKSDLFKTVNPKAMIPAVAKKIVIMALSTLVVVFGGFQIFGLGLQSNQELLGILLIAIQLLSLAFAIGTVINTLYLSKDNTMLICLPATPNQLFTSKILYIYINEFFVNLSMAIPVFVGLGYLSFFKINYYISIIPMLILMPILPIVVAAFLSIPIMAVLKFLKKHTVISIITIFSLVAAVLWVYVGFIGSIASNFDIAGKQLETIRQLNAQLLEIGKKIPVYYQLAGAMLNPSKWYVFFIIIAGCLAVFALTILFTRHFFFKTAMSSIENTIKTGAKKGEFKVRNKFASLLLKEFYCVFRSAADVFEYFLFTLLMPFIVFSYDRLLMSITVNQAGENMIAGAHVMVVAILAMLSNISSASAISRDGGNFYMSKIVPIDYYTQMFAKFTFNAIFTFGALVATAIVSMFMYPAWQIILGTIAVIFASVGHIAYSIDTDIKDPTTINMGDEKSGAVSKSTPKSLIYGLAIGFIMGLIVILLSSAENAIMPYLIIIGASLVFMIYRVYTLILRINLRYDKIEM